MAYEGDSLAKKLMDAVGVVDNYHSTSFGVDIKPGNIVSVKLSPFVFGQPDLVPDSQGMVREMERALAKAAQPDEPGIYTKTDGFTADIVAPDRATALAAVKEVIDSAANHGVINSLDANGAYKRFGIQPNLAPEGPTEGIERK